MTVAARVTGVVAAVVALDQQAKRFPPLVHKKQDLEEADGHRQLQVFQLCTRVAVVDRVVHLMAQSVLVRPVEASAAQVEVAMVVRPAQPATEFQLQVIQERSTPARAAAAAVTAIIRTHRQQVDQVDQELSSFDMHFPR